jgi:Fe2+ transport system protein FeoA
MKVSFRNLDKNVPAIISNCRCDKRFMELGILPGKEIEIIEECPFGGTVIINTQSGFLCLRREELDIDLNTKKG